VNMDQVSLTGDAIAAVVVGCAGTGQGLSGSVGVSRSERSLNWRAEPASHARLECIARHEAVGFRAAMGWGWFSRKNANRQGPEPVAAGRDGK
jgi:hypothetical protein